MISERETAELAEAFIAETCAKEGICPDQLTLHADRGSAMTSKSVAQMLADLGVTKTHSRPHVSNDNPYSESQFKTLKYRADFPGQFGSLADARAWARPFFEWYNQEHYHSGIGLLTPATVHGGQAAVAIAARQQVLVAAQQAHPERFVRGMPRPPALPSAVWINPPRASEPAMEQFSVMRDQVQVGWPMRASRSSLNSDPSCLKLLDTFRRAPRRYNRESHRHLRSPEWCCVQV